MMQVPGLRAFVRSLLPVRLSGGFTVTFGVWVGVSPGDLQTAFRLWWSDDYPTLRLQGRLANALPGWGHLGAPVIVAVLDTDHTPYCVSSSHEELHAVLSREWPHADVLDRLPH